MNGFKQLYPSLKFTSGGSFSKNREKIFKAFCALWLIIAFLEFGQDYIRSILQGTTFHIGESLSYKLFWPLFIPFFMVLDISVNKIGERTKGALYLALVIIQSLFITLIHLLTFSLVLYGFSILFHDNPMTLLFVLYEKLSTRLYIALSIYSALSGIAVYIKHRRSQHKNQNEEKPKTITVKKGKSSVFVDIDEIKWINSDGAYLDIYTTHKKHVVLDSLKSIIKILPSNFKRIHKSTIVNIEWIKKLESRGNGDYDVILNDGHQLRLSRNYTKELRGNLL